MRFLILFVVFGLAFAGFRTRLLCTDDVQKALDTAVKGCQKELTQSGTETEAAINASLIEDDMWISSEMLEPTHKEIKKYFRKCISKKMETNESAAPILEECVEKFNNGKISNDKKEKCIMENLKKSCNHH